MTRREGVLRLATVPVALLPPGEWLLPAGRHRALLPILGFFAAGAAARLAAAARVDAARPAAAPGGVTERPRTRRQYEPFRA